MSIQQKLTDPEVLKRLLVAKCSGGIGGLLAEFGYTDPAKFRVAATAALEQAYPTLEQETAALYQYFEENLVLEATGQGKYLGKAPIDDGDKPVDIYSIDHEKLRLNRIAMIMELREARINLSLEMGGNDGLTDDSGDESTGSVDGTQD